MKHSKYSTYLELFKVLYYITFINVFATDDIGFKVRVNSIQLETDTILQQVKDTSQPLTCIFLFLSSIDNLSVQFNGLAYDGNGHLNLGEFKKIKSFRLEYSYIKKVPQYVKSFNYIEHLSFYRNKLTSTCFDIISQLITLRKLDLSNNLIEKIPRCISKMVNLEELFLGRNPFNHVIINKSHDLNLKTLDLTGMRLVSNENEGLNQDENAIFNIINRFLEITTLENLILCDIDLSEFSFDNDEYYLKRLTSFYCNLSTLPYSIRKLKRLEYFDLSYNNFTTVPRIISELESLKELDLRGNHIISYENISFHSLETLHIQWNWDYNGKFSVENTPSLKHLYIYIYAGNSGQIEIEQYTIENLSSLYQYGTYKLKIPNHIITLENLEIFHMEGKLNANIIHIVLKSQNLRKLFFNLYYIYENHYFIQQLLSALKNLNNLEFLSLKDHYCSIVLDDKICDLANLKKLHIGQFFIKNIICFGELKNLESIFFENIKFCNSKKQVNLFLKQNKIKATYKNCRFSFKLSWSVKIKYIWHSIIKKLI